MVIVRSARPVQLIVAAFLASVLIGTLLLMLPIARTGAPGWPSAPGVPEFNPDSFGPALPGGAPLSVALFTASSAGSVTGLIVVDTATYWSTFGQVVLLCLMQLGGLGTMTLASLIALAMARRLGMRQKNILLASTGQMHPGQVKETIQRIVLWALSFQAVGAVVMALHLYSLGEPMKRAVGHGIFLAISAFDNAGFAPYTDSLISHAGDPFIILPVSALIIIGGLGFPILIELRRRLLLPRRWTLTTRLTIAGTLTLILGGWLAIALAEWGNVHTIGQVDTVHKLLASFFAAVSPRTAGFNSMDIAAQHDITWMITDMLMFIGGGPAGTAGGIKVTTLLVILALVRAEVRAERSASAFGRRIEADVPRQALTIVVLSGFAVVLVATVIMAFEPWGLDQAGYEAISAFATVGLSTGI
ncbi:MAG: potassium transporter TrkG, partial [Bowdeniella nasicola]|nr:potassium transporter TrkG [Bowdeniella nasicola]